MDTTSHPAFIPLQAWKRAFYFSCTRRAVEYLQEHFDSHLNLAILAEVACMERTAFSKSFKRKTGTSFRQFLQAYRISQATEIMNRSDYSITEIAYAVGFGTLSTFERAFRKTVGTTPSQYRAEVMRNNGLLLLTTTEGIAADVATTCASKRQSVTRGWTS